MKIIKLLLLIVSISLFTSCEIVQEIKFEQDGSGTYSLGFDMTEMMKMGANSSKKNDSTGMKQIDTVIRFSDFLKVKKDSIKKLSKEDREKIALLKDFELYMKADTVSDQLVMKIAYNFKDISDLNRFGEKLEGQKVKELDIFSNQLKGKDKNRIGKGESKIPDFNESFETTFSSTGFTRKITKKAFKDAVAKKDTTMKKDSPMSDLIKFKQRFIFPYKIKSVSDENARILSDFKGIEQEANMYEMNNNPNFFDIEVTFENE